jgi:hypothetical protein
MNIQILISLKNSRSYRQIWEGESEKVKAKILRIHQHARYLPAGTALRNMENDLEEAHAKIVALEDSARKSWL